MSRIEVFKEFARRLRRSKYGWSGDYASWEEAKKLCSGYDADNILEKVKYATLKVKNGEAAYERDSVLFDQVEYSWPLLSGLMWIAAQNKGSLNVVDFGGALGSTWFQNRKFLDGLDNITWNIIEQENFVTCGKGSFQDPTLQFYHTLDQCITPQRRPDVLLLSCVLPYLEQPYRLLEQLMAYGLPYILIDNTYFNYENRDRICIQTVPPDIYEASYPSWFLHYEKIKALLEQQYVTISEHVNTSGLYLDGRKIPYTGILLKKLPA